ncbi:hypothetical protein Bca52824_094861 [Brassica carinata]|uniref:Folate-biopterin transporter 7 n=1 Tax=Brassica carinata TaxID=52824 RepID=A0A8X7P2T0_BRACI|nr:hypothetical protein Bca52824_094861 [Brassica carinata]
MSSDGGGSRRIRWLLGFGFFVQGFRGFPWLGANFFLTDELRVNPSVLQLLQNSANLPMVAKPIYGVVSDAVYFFGQHRVPYIAFGALLQAVSWLAIAFLARSNVSILALSLYLLLSNLGASVVEVANDAIVAEAGKRKSASSGELPSFVWMASSLGGILGNLLGGIAIKTFSSQSTFLVFGLLALLQFLVTLNIREKSLNLPENHSPSGGGGGIKSHVSDLSRVLRKPEISYSIAWMALSTALVPVLTGTMFFYQTKILNMDASLLGISKEADRSHSGNYSCLRGVGPIVRERSVQRLGSGGLCLRALRFGDIGDFVLFQEPAVHGVDDEAVSRGCEGSLMAFVMSAIALAFIVSGYLGIVLASFVEVTVDDHSGFAGGLAVEAVCVVVPLVFTSWIYDEEEKSKKEE